MKRHGTNSSGSRRAASGLGRAYVVRGGKRAVQPPEPGPGQVTCPACRNAVHVLKSGAMRKHRDLFGHDCYQRTFKPFRLTELPPVVLPPERSPR